MANTLRQPPLREGQRWVSAGWLNRLPEDIARLTEASGPGDSGFEQGAFHVGPALPETFLARIIGLDASTPPMYAWELVEDHGYGDYLDSGAGLRGGIDGPCPPAFEDSGNPDVPIDGTAVVRLWPSRGGINYCFSYCCGAAAGFSLTVKEEDGTPTYTDTVTLTFDQDRGYSLTQPGAGEVLVGMLSVGRTQVGVVDLEDKQWLGAGIKIAPTEFWVYGNTVFGDFELWTLARIVGYSGAADSDGLLLGAVYESCVWNVDNEVLEDQVRLQFRHGGSSPNYYGVMLEAEEVVEPRYMINVGDAAAPDYRHGDYGTLQDGTKVHGGIVTEVGSVTLAPLVGVPASAGAAGDAGSISFDASFLYICTATNTWKRVAIATW